MSLDQPQTVDAVGIDKESGAVILTIADSWDWQDERPHLLALQAKLNAYFSFIESGQLSESHPNAPGRPLIIEVVSRFALPTSALDVMQRASLACRELGISIRGRHQPG